MKISICFLCGSVLLSGCLNKETAFETKPSTGASTTVSLAMPAMESQKESEKADDYSENGSSPAGQSKIPVEQLKLQKSASEIIRNARIQFQVKDVLETHQRISELLKSNNAYFSADNKESNTYRIDYNLTIRVPAANMDKLMNAIMQESVYTNYKNIIAEDITAEFVDTETRLKTKKEVEQRYLALLKQAAKVSDILEVEGQLRLIREEIESAEGRLKLMKDQVAYSTINLNLYQTLPYAAQPEIGFIAHITEAVENGWRAFIYVLIGLTSIWPFVIIVSTGLFWLIRRIRRKKV